MAGSRPTWFLDSEWWRGAVIYQIYPRSFQDSNGDGIGDLKGIAQRLDHVAWLGADAIWISPFFTSPMLDFGYDISDFRNVDPIFGTLNDFRAVINRAHALNLKVLIDLVVSHTSDHHPWFKESRQSRTNPKADWYVWADPKPDGTPPNNWLSIFGGTAWDWEPRREQYYLHNFLKEQPDLNYHNPEVQNEVLDITRFWLETGVDGFRLDTVNFYFHDAELRDNPPNPSRVTREVPPSNPYGWQHHVYDKARPETIGFLKRFRALLDEYGNVAAVGEIGDGERAVKLTADYTSGSDRLHMCYSFDFLTNSLDRPHFEKTIREFEQIVPDGWGCWAFSNHDVKRHVSRWSSLIADEALLARFCIALLVALRGSISLYQGEELGLLESDVPYDAIQDPYGRVFWPSYKGRDGCRTPMIWESGAPNAGFSSASRPWLPVDQAQTTRAVDVLAQQSDSILADYRVFLGLRRKHEALRKGSLNILPSMGDVLAFERRRGDERIACVFNFGIAGTEWTFPKAMRAKTIERTAINAKMLSETVQFAGCGAIYLIIM
jgi:alpha-glucosidase